MKLDIINQSDGTSYIQMYRIKFRNFNGKSQTTPYFTSRSAVRKHYQHMCDIGVYKFDEFAFVSDFPLFIG